MIPEQCINGEPCKGRDCKGGYFSERDGTCRHMSTMIDFLYGNLNNMDKSRRWDEIEKTVNKMRDK